jgi:hypothetical protein
MTLQKFFFKKIPIWVSKNAEFNADFKCVEMSLKNYVFKTLRAKKPTKKALNPENSN